MDIKFRIRVISLVLFLSVIGVWAVFYFIMSSYIAVSTEKQISIASNQIIEKFGGEFALAERLSRSLAGDADVKDLIAQRAANDKYPLAEKVWGAFSEQMQSSGFIEHAIIFGSGSYYIRMMGKLGNKSCLRLSRVVSSLSLPGHLVVDLESGKYIGYANAITTETAGVTGAAVILIEEEKILEVLHTYDQSGSLQVAVIANGEVIAANTERIELFTADGSGQPIVNSRLGITPYEIAVAVDAGYMNASVVYFTVVALITAAIFVFVLFMYSGILNRRFFRPMVKVIDSIDKLNTEITTETLPHVKSVEFDGLIDKINEMLIHLETKNNEVNSAELRAKNAEIEKQKALVFSLKKQINAHFTINTLNTVRILVEQGELKNAEIVAAGLISLIRYAYDKDERINIWDEFEILQKYMDIMNGRYAGKLKADFDFDDRLMDYSMPRMLLQPILENAVIHGFSAMDTGCELSVKAELTGDAICFLVSDNGAGMSEEDLLWLMEKLSSSPESAQGYGNDALLNIRNRLYYYYGNAGRLAIRHGKAGGMEVSVTIPSQNGWGGVL